MKTENKPAVCRGCRTMLEVLDIQCDEIKKLRSVLESIAFLRELEADKPQFWKGSPLDTLSEVVATDTKMARDALGVIGHSYGCYVGTGDLK